HLSTRIFGKKIYCLDVIDSTNNYAKALASQEAEEGTVVVAEYQGAGRGRFGRTWVSAPGQNLTFSVIIRPSMPPQGIGVISLYAGLAVANAVHELCGVAPTCKWPNDVLLNDKKICGIL